MGSLDLLVASTPLHHDAELVSLDSDLEQITDVCALGATDCVGLSLGISAPNAY